MEVVYQWQCSENDSHVQKGLKNHYLCTKKMYPMVTVVLDHLKPNFKLLLTLRNTTSRVQDFLLNTDTQQFAPLDIPRLKGFPGHPTPPLPPKHRFKHSEGTDDTCTTHIHMAWPKELQTPQGV